MDDGPLQIRSYRVVFDLERRIHRIDRFRVPLPYGLPLRSTGYALVSLLAVVVAARLPVLGDAVSALPAPVRLVLAPLAASFALTRTRLDGRSAHAALACWIRYVSSPRELVGFAGRSDHPHVRLSDLVMAPGLTGNRWRRGLHSGPAELFVGVPFRQRRHRDRIERIELALGRTEAAGPGLVTVAAGESVELR